MNRNIVRAVWKRDLRSWFGNPTGYVFIILFVVFACLALMFSSAFFTNNLANLQTLNDPWFPLLAIVFVSASTMNIWASERSNGTQELLFTLPGSDFDLQLGKFLSAVSVYTVSLLFTLVMPIALMFLGNPDIGQLIANYIGYWLFGVMLVAASILLGGGWGVTYALGPVVLTRLVTAEERVRYFALNSVFLMAGFGLSPVMAAEIEGAGGTVNDAFFITAVNP